MIFQGLIFQISGLDFQVVIEIYWFFAAELLTIQ
jgi:hypothetical protein